MVRSNPLRQVLVRARGLRRAGQNRLHHTPHTLLAQLVRQIVDMGVAAQDQPLLRRQDGVRRDRARAVTPHLVLEACLPAQRVHQPRLPGGPRQDQPHRLLRERLAGRRRVLRQQRPHLLLREVAQSQRLGLDVEGAAAEHHAVLGGRVDAAVAHVTHPAQDDAVREGGRTLVVAAAQLPQHRQQGVAHQRVDLVDQQHQRLAVGSGPATQRQAQCAT